MDVVIVELPSKAKTINKYLGKGFKVLASYGHVRDLPSKDGSVLPDEDFAMAWDVDPKSQKRLNDIAEAVKGADKLILATDPDREGEAISWHVLEVLNRKKALKGVEVERVVFNAITKNSVLQAMAHPRGLDKELIDAYLARRALDYLVGFTLSPVLWRKLPGARSAGRVQSVALRLICDRELEIEAFRAQEYWTIETDLKTAAGAPFVARIVSLDGKKLDKFDIPNQKTADDIVARIKASHFRVKSVESKPTRRNPYPPFTTSTLQQEASPQARLLGRAARCRSPSASMRASRSTAKRPASSPICEPTACRSPTKRSRRCAPSSTTNSARHRSAWSRRRLRARRDLTQQALGHGDLVAAGRHLVGDRTERVRRIRGIGVGNHGVRRDASERRIRRRLGLAALLGFLGFLGRVDDLLREMRGNFLVV